MSHVDIADACVVGVPEEAAGELPRAYVVLKPGKTLTETQVQGWWRCCYCVAHALAEFVNQHVAQHKRLRGGVVFLDAIPKTASGKILRRVLRDQARAEASAARPSA